MAGQRQPIELVLAKGNKHLTKAEIEARRKSEIGPLSGDITPPAYLTKKQKAEFNTIAGQLQELKIIGETDVDALARYIVANTFYVNAVKKMRTKEVRDDPELFASWLKVQEKMFNQCRQSANDLGLTISSRCRLVVPAAEKTEVKQNKFKKFEKRPAIDE
ncbi:MAG: phage terminase small subunit P27 family [Kiritimatiellae bacterium]|nr:phage terminase small subunit P27 family [Kiritimatiellia bacterium]